MDDADENAQNDDVIGYDKAAQQFADEYYGNGNYTSDESGSDEESSDYTSDESGSDEESSDSDSDKDKDSDSDKYKYKYACKYKYKYACKSSDKPSDEPKDKPKDDKQTDQKYSVNCISTRKYDTDSDESDREIVSDAQMRSLKLACEALYRTNEKF